jgi:hypothetical protein
VDRKFLENKGFGDRLIEINDGEMPSEILENRKFGLGGISVLDHSWDRPRDQSVFLSSVDFAAFGWIITNEPRRKVCMKPAPFLVALSILLLIPPNSVVAKGVSVGIYAIVDEVTFEPNDSSPNFVRISGVFVVPVRMSSGSYQRPQKGYLYFRIAPGAEQATRRDWAELTPVAGSGKVVAFGEYWVPNPDDPQGNPHHSLEVTVHAEGDNATPDVYPIPHARGVMKADDIVHDANHDPRFDMIVAQLQAASHR